MKDESTVSQEIQIQAMHHACNLMRNNSGACIDNTGRLVRYGLGNISKAQTALIASSDLIGITKVVVTQEMVGSTVGIFTAIEVKREDWKEDKKFSGRERAQQAFINWVKNNGGIASFCNSVDKLKEILAN
jgi:hypothetical protein